VAAVLLVVVTAVVAFRVLHEPHRNFDLRVYRGALQSWSAHGDLYGFGLGHNRLGFTYPPFAAICLLPLVVLPLGATVVMNQVAIVAALVASTRLLVSRLPALNRPGVTFTSALLAPLLLLLQPIRDTLTFGQVDLTLGLLVLVDLVLVERGSRWAGVGVGLATAIKLTPGLFVLLYLAAGARRPARTAVLSFLLATGAAALVDPHASTTYWTSALWDSSRVGSYDSATNQSLAGLLARLTNSSHPPLVWFPLVLAVTIPALIAAGRLYRDGRLLPAFTVVGLTANAISPISWVHHLFWVMPAVLVLADEGLRRRSRTLLVAAAASAALFMSGLPDLTRAKAGHHLDDAVTVLGENAYAVALLALLALLGMGGCRHRVTTRPAAATHAVP
jgi:alpha-1,2-mannosyltransferase